MLEVTKRTNLLPNIDYCNNPIQNKFIHTICTGLFKCSALKFRLSSLLSLILFSFEGKLKLTNILNKLKGVLEIDDRFSHFYTLTFIDANTMSISHRYFKFHKND